jgi:2-oxo-4-hydroxy-4-carboxy--5-ureidoimidazoline (OHCU) decarboxylase
VRKRNLASDLRAVPESPPHRLESCWQEFATALTQVKTAALIRLNELLPR